MQALLDKRTHMLKIHQRMGLITTGPLLATLFTSVNAGGKNTSNTDRTVHMILGATTADLYGITAYYAIRAPRVPGTQTKGPIRFHKAMAYIHVPGMILTPILGAMAYSQKNNGRKSARHRRGPRPCSHRHRRSLRSRSLVSFSEVLRFL